MLHQDLSINQSAVCAPEENDVVFDETTFDQFNPVTTVDVNNILHSINSTNCKLDSLPAVFLKKCSSIVINAITIIINNSLKSSQVPLKIKKAIISPLLKSHNLDPDTLADYRPISDLSFLSKVLEKVVAGQLNEHLAISNIHDKFQSSYRPGFSTETALIRITDDILFALDNKCFTRGGVFRPWPRGRPRGHILKSLALATKVKSLASSPRKLACPRLEDSTIF